jgi:hypothetical protein
MTARSGLQSRQPGSLVDTYGVKRRKAARDATGGPCSLLRWHGDPPRPWRTQDEGVRTTEKVYAMTSSEEWLCVSMKIVKM